MDTITLQEVNERMDAGEVFSIAFVTADLHKKKGGEWITIEDARKFTGTATRGSASPEMSGSNAGKSPNHFVHRTRNILLKNGEIRKLRIRLIRRFNGKTVI